MNRALLRIVATAALAVGAVGIGACSSSHSRTASTTATTTPPTAAPPTAPVASTAAPAPSGGAAASDVASQLAQVDGDLSTGASQTATATQSMNTDEGDPSK
jgi:hypothetical protein